MGLREHGGITSLLRLVRDHADAVEADIQWRYHVDYRDLDLVRLAVFVRHLPDSSAIAAIGRDGPRWSVEAHLLDDVRMWLMILAGADKKYVKPHSQRPVARATPDPARQMKLIDARKRARERKRKIEAGEIA